MTAPIAPATKPPNSDWLAAPIAAPHNAPVTIRAMNPGGAFRLGVLGSLSLISSPIASTLTMYGVAAKLRNASQVFSRWSQPKRAAQLTAASGVSGLDRNQDGARTQGLVQAGEAEERQESNRLDRSRPHRRRRRRHAGLQGHADRRRKERPDCLPQDTVAARRAACIRYNGNCGDQNQERDD